MSQFRRSDCTRVYVMSRQKCSDVSLDKADVLVELAEIA